MALNPIYFLPLLHILRYAHAQSIPCATPDAPQNGVVEGVQPKIKYKCDYGYKLSGRDTNYCNVAGSWTYPTPTCNVVTCPKLTAPTNGRMDPSSPDVTFDTTVTFACNLDYSLKGAAQVTCRENGMWEPGPLPACKEAECEIPSKPRLKVETEYDSHLPGGFIYYSCDEPWHLLDPHTTQATCSLSNQWEPSRIPDCLDCPDLETPDHGHIEGEKPRITYKCDDLYELEGSDTNVCEQAKWKYSTPTCKTCPPPETPDHGYIEGANPRITYKCDDLYVLEGSDTNVCENAKWTHSTPTCKTCPPPTAPDHGYIEGANPQITYKCDDLYVLEGSDTNVCENAKWTHSTPTCKTCPPPTVPDHGYIEGANPRITYKCDVGYELEGNDTNVCENAKWTLSTPTCKTCPQPEDPDHGYIEGSNPRITYKCDDLYVLEGSDTNVCENAKWTHSTPTCKTCPPPEAPDHGDIEGSNPRITYKCDVGYKLEGNDTNVCENAKWTHSTPTCKNICKPCKPDHWKEIAIVLAVVAVVIAAIFAVYVWRTASKSSNINDICKPCKPDHWKVIAIVLAIVAVMIAASFAVYAVWTLCKSSSINDTCEPCKPDHWKEIAIVLAIVAVVIAASFAVYAVWTLCKSSSINGGICACVCKKMCKSSNGNEGGEAAVPLKDVNGSGMKDHQPVHV